MSPIFDDSKLENIESDESDLEEGEILDIESVIEEKGSSKSYFSNGSDDILKRRQLYKTEINDETSTDGELISGSENDSDSSSAFTYKEHSRKTPKRKHGQTSYGMVKDIMTQIDLTVSRKRHYNYKRRSKEVKHSLEKKCGHRCHTKEYRSQEISRNHCRSRRRKRSSSGDLIGNTIISKSPLKSPRKTDLENKEGTEKYEKKVEEIVSLVSDEELLPKKRKRSISKKRDFDQTRFKLLENLKQKSSPRVCQSIPLPAEEEYPCSDIQEIEMADDSNMFVDSLPAANSEDNVHPKPLIEKSKKSYMDTFYTTRNIPEMTKNVQDEAEEQAAVDDEEDDDDTNLIKLRLLALTSNRKKVEPESGPGKGLSADEVKNSSTEKGSEENKPLSKDEDDVFKYEMILRAEALKTAMIKRCQKRRNKSHANDTTKQTVDEKVLQSDDPAKTDQTMIEKAESVHKHQGKNYFHLIQNHDTGSLVSQRKGKNGTSSVKITNADATRPSTGVAVNNMRIATTQNVPAENLKSFVRPLIEPITLPQPFNQVAVHPVKIMVPDYSLIDPPLLPVTYQPTSSFSQNFKPRNNENVKGIQRDRSLKRRRKRLQGKLDKRLKKLGLTKNLLNNSTKFTERCDDDQKLRAELLNDLNIKKSVKENALVGPRPKFITRPVMPEEAVNKPQPAIGITLPPKVAPVTEMERIIVHLGVDSSDDDEDYVSALKTKTCRFSYGKGPGKNPESKVSVAVSKDKSNVINVDYERSVELLLLQARQKIEGQPAKSRTDMATPEAVYKHLPPSQRLEYIRLKQKIAERERMKNAKSGTTKAPAATSVSWPAQATTSTSTSVKRVFPNKVISPKNSTTVTAINEKTKILSSSISTKNGTVTVASASPRKNVWSPLKNNGANLRNSSKEDDLAQQKKKRLAQTQLDISKLKLLLKNIKLEKTVEERYEKEIKRLTSQISLLQLKRNQQRMKIQKMATESKKIYHSIQLNRSKNHTNKENVEATLKTNAEASAKPNADTSLKESVENALKLKDEALIKKDLEIPDPSDMATLHSAMAECVKTEIADKIIISKQIQSDIKCEKNDACDTLVDPISSVKIEEDNKHVDKTTEVYKEHSTSVTVKDLKEYNSPLQAFTIGTNTPEEKRVDPNTVMCQFDLLGVCNDNECKYQHCRRF